MVNVYDSSGDVIARVHYRENLDYWNGSNYTCGSTGHHKGLTKLSDGRFVLIHGSQWEGEKKHAEIISARQAVQEILISGNNDLFDDFPKLKALRDKTLIPEAY